MKKSYAYTIPEFQSYDTSSRLWRLFAFSLLCFLLGPALSFHSIAKTGSSSGLANNEAIIWLATPGTGPILDCYVKEVTITSSVHRDGVNLDEGATFQWTGPDGFSSNAQDIKVTKPGIYNIVAKTANGLTGNNAIEILGENYPKSFAGPDLKMYPANKTVVLQGYSHGYYDISWEASNGGNIVSGGNTLNPIIDAPGTYTITLTQRLGGCTMQDAMVVTEAEEDTFSARIFSDPIRFTCPGPNYAFLRGFALLNEEYTNEGITYQWSGPNGYTSNKKDVGVTEPGEYVLVVTDTIRNLTASDTLYIMPPKQPTGSAGPDKILTNQNSTVTLEGSGDSRVMWLASDGGNIVSGQETYNPVVDAPGTYTMIMTDPRSGCRFEDTVVVTREEDTGTFTANIGLSNVPELKCTEPSFVGMNAIAKFTGYNYEGNFTYQWSGPNGYTSTDKSVKVSEPGEYILVITETIGNLTASDSYTVKPPKYPTGSAGPDKMLTCKNNTVTLEGTGDGLYVVWSASHGGNIISGELSYNPVVDAPGIYKMVITDVKTGCTFEDEVKVIWEEEMTVSATGGQLDCTSGTVQLMGFASAEGVTYAWTGPNGFASSEQNPVVKVAGTYTLTVADPAGSCSASTSVVVTPASTGVEITQHTIDFDSKQRGLISSIETEAGPVAITGRKRNADGTYAPENHAAIFDSQDPTGDDTNLYTTDWGQVLIINQYQNDYPDATQWGGELILDFSAIGPVTMESFRVVGMDNFEDLSWVYLYDANGKELNKVYLKPLGMNSKQLVNLGNTRGVVKMKVVLDGRDGSGDFAGSAAIDNIKFHKETATNSPCITAAENFTHAMAYPTAFSDRTTVEFIVRETEDYSINLYDAQGMLVKQLQSGTARAGEMTRVEVNGRDLKEGMYFARLVGSSGSKTFKLVLKR